MRPTSRVFKRIVLWKMDFYRGKNVARIWKRIAGGCRVQKLLHDRVPSRNETITYGETLPFYTRSAVRTRVS